MYVLIDSNQRFMVIMATIKLASSKEACVALEAHMYVPAWTLQY